MTKLNEYKICDFSAKSGYPISNQFPYVYVSSDIKSTKVKIILEHKKTLDKITLNFNISSNELYKYYDKLKTYNQTQFSLIKSYLTDNFNNIIRLNKLNQLL